MSLIWKTVESLTEPQKLDNTSSPGGVYLRKDIQEVTYKDAEGKKQSKWVYSEAFLTAEEYATYMLEQAIAQAILQEDNSEAFKNYKTKLDTPVEYTNGFLYKAKWVKDASGRDGIYIDLLQKGTMLPTLFPLKIWDATETEENAALMSMQDLMTLTIFLAQKQEQYFNEYKLEKAAAEATV